MRQCCDLDARPGGAAPAQLTDATGAVDDALNPSAPLKVRELLSVPLAPP